MRSDSIWKTPAKVANKARPIGSGVGLRGQFFDAGLNKDYDFVDQFKALRVRLKLAQVREREES